MPFLVYFCLSIYLNMFHSFDLSIAHLLPPKHFTYPFHYTPHPLTVMATEQLKAYLETQIQWSSELTQGKMFGVLVVQNKVGEIGFLAAFSGNLQGTNRHTYFVPPVFDMLQSDGFFKIGEQEISAINNQLEAIQRDVAYITVKQNYQLYKAHVLEELAKAKLQLRLNKEHRDAQRKTETDTQGLLRLTRESQFEHAEYKRLEKYLQSELHEKQHACEPFDQLIATLKQTRKIESACLQQKLFDQFLFLNSRGEEKSLNAIFKQRNQQIPPAGAGECAAPKLLQYAYANSLKPLAMGEFWWGKSPKTEIRKHGCFYPACKGKCEPILNFMLQGLSVEPNPLCQRVVSDDVTILFEDEYLIITDKSAGLLSVSGKINQISAHHILLNRYPNFPDLKPVHRLDMATSGLLLFAKTHKIYTQLQSQFIRRTVKKRYVALLEGVIEEEHGIINLPLCLDIFDRPRQMVHFELGKPALTRWEVLTRDDDRTRVAFYPETGRTHQLRVHAAHELGLNHPIIGDELYGHKAERLFLHAEELTFCHPMTCEQMTFLSPAPF